MKSVSLVFDSPGAEPSGALSIFEGMNEAIDSIHKSKLYKDAGQRPGTKSGMDRRVFPAAGLQ